MRVLRLALAVLALSAAACAPARTAADVAGLPLTSGGADLSGIRTIRIEIDRASVEETSRFVELLREEVGLRSDVRTVFGTDPSDVPTDARLVVLGRWTVDAIGRKTFVARLDLFRGDATEVAWHHATSTTHLTLTPTEGLETAARSAARRLAAALKDR